MYEDHTVEDKYLTNFSRLEKFWFRLEQAAQRRYLKAYKNYVNHVFKTHSSDPILCFEEPSTALEIKYILNRISQNDPRDKSFTLTLSDGIKNGDKMASLIAKAFENNSACSYIELEIGLSDNGAKIILDALRHKSLFLLNLNGNNLTSRTFAFIDQILSDAENHWGMIHINKPKTEDETFKHLIQNPKIKVDTSPSSIKEPPSFVEQLVRFAFIKKVLAFDRFHPQKTRE